MTNESYELILYINHPEHSWTQDVKDNDKDKGLKSILHLKRIE